MTDTEDAVYDPYRRAKNTLPAAALDGVDWQRHVLAMLLGESHPDIIDDEQMDDPALWLLAYANLSATRGSAEPAVLYTDLATKVEALGELQDMLRDGIVAPMWDAIHKLNKAVSGR